MHKFLLNKLHYNNNVTIYLIPINLTLIKILYDGDWVSVLSSDEKLETIVIYFLNEISLTHGENVDYSQKLFSLS